MAVNQEAIADSSDIFQVLADDYARRILVAADDGPMTAKALSDACDASLATVYRRVSKLQNHGLLDERTSIDSDGTHRREFETVLEGLHVDLSEGEFTLTVDTCDTLADNFTELWDDMRVSQ
ncbi:winged helix-turn-helix domain-containing protein [Natronosalvus halobius]|uniref:winged helix-turn-helix domain-containing protein n=1 Tax=Natronosalvus halobius TaxID=2953746 RepID=UPI00209F1154|nr:helix-turn-helix domain-containing protein [Natronosalvus halobius]USZ73468.1 helix-turn-helix domain-containing protein [Natronosalvus halobius]